MSSHSQNAELAATIEQFVKNRRAPGTSLQLAIAFSEEKWAQIVAALRAQQDGPSDRDAVLEEAVEAIFYTAHWRDAQNAVRALKNAAPQAETPSASDGQVGSPRVPSLPPAGAAPCGTCNDDPAVCATVPGLRHCEAANRAQPEAGAERDPNDPDPVEHARELAVALIEARKELVEIRPEAARYRWLRERPFGADFEHSSIEKGAGWALIFCMPEGSTISANLDKSLDEAMASSAERSSDG